MNHSNEPLVSVCVITYNQADYIEQCLDSILNQEADFPFEICLGEDASDDGTREICQRYADMYPHRINLSLRKREDVIYLNGAPTGTFNFFQTLKECKGDYIAICEGDDFWLDTRKLQQQVDALLTHPECAVCFCNVRVDYDDGTPSHPGYVTPLQKKIIRKKKIGLIVKPPETFGIEKLAERNCIHTPGVLFKNWIKSESLPGYLWSTGLADWALHMNSARFGKLLFVDETMAAYRVHGKGFWSTVEKTKQYQILIGTMASLLTSDLFPQAARDILAAELGKQILRAWTYARKNDAPHLVAELLDHASKNHPSLLPFFIQAIWKRGHRYPLAEAN